MKRLIGLIFASSALLFTSNQLIYAMQDGSASQARSVVRSPTAFMEMNALLEAEEKLTTASAREPLDDKRRDAARKGLVTKAKNRVGKLQARARKLIQEIVIDLLKISEVLEHFTEVLTDEEVAQFSELIPQLDEYKTLIGGSDDSRSIGLALSHQQLATGLDKVSALLLLVKKCVAANVEALPVDLLCAMSVAVINISYRITSLGAVR